MKQLALLSWLYLKSRSVIHYWASKGMHDVANFICSWLKAVTWCVKGSFFNPCPVCFTAVSGILNGKWVLCNISAIPCLDVCLQSLLVWLVRPVSCRIKEQCVTLVLGTVKHLLVSVIISLFLFFNQLFPNLHCSHVIYRGKKAPSFPLDQDQKPITVWFFAVFKHINQE